MKQEISCNGSARMRSKADNVRSKGKVDVSEWIQKSLRNLDAAKDLYEGGHYDFCVFHCHQSIELILKACWLYFLRRTFPSGRRGHDLPKLYVPSLHKFIKLSRKQVELLEDLTPRYYNTRYPELLGYVRKNYAKKCLKVTEEIVQCCVKKLS